MNSLTGVTALLALASSALCQSSWLSPAGYSFVQGNTDAFSSVPFYAANARYQYLDATQVGTPRANINRVEIRRRPSVVPGNFPARTTTLTVIMAHTSLASVSTSFATNYKNAAATTVYSGPFNLPDLSAGPISAPSPFTIAVPFTTNFSYNGADDLLIEFQCAGTSPSAQHYPLDCVDAPAIANGFGFFNSEEHCTVGANPFYINFDHAPTWAGANVTLDQYGTGAPPSQPGAILIGIGQLYTN